MKKFLLTVVLLGFFICGGQNKLNSSFGPYSTNEKDVAGYLLPELLRFSDGTPVDSVQKWERRRSEILDILKRESYGEILPVPDKLEVKLLAEKKDALNGCAVRKELEIICRTGNGKSFSFIMLLYLPKNVSGPVPAFVGLNFKGNHASTSENDVIITGRKDEPRGIQAYRWCFEEVVKRGYASATICYHDIHPDKKDGAKESVFTLFFDEISPEEIRKKYSVIGSWAWGLSRALEVLQREESIDKNKIIVHGHSRLGKTALWAGATDQRFAMIISNNSGCGGAALHKRKFGENLSQHFEAHLQRDLPVWFVENLRKYIGKEELMPFDQHFLLALAAPRQLCVSSATLDFGADPYGEFLSCIHASQAYGLFGYEALELRDMIAPDTHIGNRVHYHYRTGKHDQTWQDWKYYLAEADKNFKQNNYQKEIGK